MKKTTYFFLLQLLLAHPLFSQSNKLSPSTRTFQSNYTQLNKTSESIRALVQVKSNMTEAVLASYGATMQTKAGDIWSITAPVSALQALAAHNSVSYIEASVSARPQMNDTDWKNTRTQLVHEGYNLPDKYTGKNVVIGIIDIGFDYTHPAFYDAQGNCRIKKVWEQHKDSRTAPTGFGYGRELTTPADIKAAGTDRNDESHGTMVAGIAAGTGIGSKNGANRGVAPGADLVLVALKYGERTFLDDRNTAAPSFVDAISYIYQYAASVNKPAVINISWGHHSGPHDGTTLLDKAIENLTGPGKILVNAAGNEGGDLLHFSKQLNNDTFNTYCLFWYNPFLYEKDLTDFWGSPNTDFSVQIKWVDSADNLVAATPFYPASGDQLVSQFLVNGPDSLIYSFACQKKNPNNNRPEIFVNYKCTNAAKYRIVYSFTSSNTTLDAWNGGYEWSKGYGVFFPYQFDKPVFRPNYLMGDHNSTIGESGGNSKASITVGSYNSNLSWYTYSGSLTIADDPSLRDTLTFFSSIGPATDGRTKPDITAPGYYVGGPTNSLYVGFLDNTAITDTVITTGRTYKWIMSTGTSFAAPCVTGAVALMLQNDPTLTPLNVVANLKTTARQDAKTGTLPFTGSNGWGWGKIDVYSAVRTVVKNLGVTELDAAPHTVIYPNPFYDVISMDNGEPATIAVFTSEGKKVFSKQVSPGEVIDLHELQTGIYFVQVQETGGRTTYSKLIKAGQ